MDTRAPTSGVAPTLLSGLLLGLAGAPFGLGALVLVALAPWLAWLQGAPGARRAAGSGVLLGVLAYGIPFAFIGFAPVEHAAAIFVAGVGLLAVSSGAVGALLAASSRLHPGAPLALAPLVWVGVETLRSHPALGLPWLHLSFALADVPALAWGAGVVGSAGLSAGVVGANAAGVAWRRGPGRALAVALLLLWALPAALGALGQLAGRGVASSRPALRVAAAQPHLPWEAGLRRGADQHTLDRLVGLSQRAAGQGADLIVWPETAYEREVPPEGDAFLGVLARSLDVPLLVGARRRTPGGATRNSVILARAGGESVPVADKAHPLPLVERAPSGPLSRAIARRGLWTGRHEPGGAPRVVEIPRAGGSVPVGVLVCADLAHAGLARSLRAQGAALLIHVTDESGLAGWAGGLHARMARLRALELGVPVVRVANHGPSLWLAPDGSLLGRVDADSAAVATRAVHPAGPPQRLPASEAQVLAALGLLTGMPAIWSRRRALPGHEAFRLTQPPKETST